MYILVNLRGAANILLHNTGKTFASIFVIIVVIIIVMISNANPSCFSILLFVLEGNSNYPLSQHR